MISPKSLRVLLGGLVPQATFCEVDAELVVTDLVSDSREVSPGAAFLAVTTPESDGVPFIDDALRRGASVVILRGDARPDLQGPAVRLPDTSAAWPALASAMFDAPGSHLKIAGVTGTNGKTTCTWLVSACLQSAGIKHARIGTTGHLIVDEEVDTQHTTPFPTDLQRALHRAVAKGATHAVMEVSSHGLDQGRVEPLRFHAVAMTSFSQDHLDYHPTMEAYLAAKCLLAGHYLRGDGVAVATGDDMPQADDFFAATRGQRCWRTSLRGDVQAQIQVLHRSSVQASDSRLVGSSTLLASGTRLVVETPRGQLELVTPMIGEYNLQNVLTTIGLGIALDLPDAALIEGLGRSRGAPGRLEPVAVTGIDGPRVFVDYAHSPDAVERALAALRPSCSGRLIVLLGCGGDRDPTKRPLMGAAARHGADVFYATSDNPRSEDPERIVDAMLAPAPTTSASQSGPQGPAQVLRMVDRAQAIAHAIAHADPQDTVLIAGKGHETYQILATGKIDFDDRSHAAAALSRRARA